MILWDGHDAALLGVAARCGEDPVAVYDAAAMVAGLMAGDDGMSEEDAEEYVAFNIAGAWVGPRTPLLLRRATRAELDAEADAADA